MDANEESLLHKFLIFDHFQKLDQKMESILASTISTGCPSFPLLLFSFILASVPHVLLDGSRYSQLIIVSCLPGKIRNFEKVTSLIALLRAMLQLFLKS